jgi:predicted DNA-binding transcriptional regulator YafY
VELSGKSEAFEVNLEDLDEHEARISEDISIATLLVRKGKSPALRNEGLITDYDSEWDKVEVQYQSPSHLLREVLWAGENAIILQPEDLRARLIESLKQVVATHG